MTKIGSRTKVMNGSADQTAGGLKKKDLFRKNGRIKSKRASRASKKNNNLVKAGWVTEKGKFGAVKRDKRKGQRLKAGESLYLINIRRCRRRGYRRSSTALHHATTKTLA